MDAISLDSIAARITSQHLMSDNLSRADERVHSTVCQCNLSSNLTETRSESGSSQSRMDFLEFALTQSGAVSGSIFLLDSHTGHWNRAIGIVRGQEVPTGRRDNTALEVVSPALEMSFWDLLCERKEVLWLDCEWTDTRQSLELVAFHVGVYHRFVAYTPMIDNWKTIGFLVLAWDDCNEIHPSATWLSQCRELADQAIVALRLTRNAIESQAYNLNNERRTEALERARELEQANELLRRRDRLLKALTDASSLQLRMPGTDTAILESLQILAEAGDFQRAGILKNVDAAGRPGKGYWSVLFEWAAVGFIQQKTTSFTTIAWHDLDPTNVFISQLSQGIVVDGRQDETEGEQAQMMETISARYTINAPILVDGIFWGVLAMDDCVTSRRRSDGERSAILAAAQMIGLAIDHRDVRQQQTRLERQLTIERETIAIERAEMIERVNQALRRCARRLLRAKDVPSVIAETIAAAGDVFSRGSIVYSGLVVFNRAEACFELKVAQRAAEGGTFNEAQDRPTWDLMAEGDPWDNISSRDYCCVQIDDYDWLHEFIREACVALGSRTVVLMRLQSDDHPQGYLFFAQANSACPANESMWLCQALAAQVSLSLEIERLTSDSSHMAVAEERNRMAREIHDTLAQGFLGIILQLNAAQKHFDDLDYVRTAIENSIHLARDNLQEARRSVRMLRGHVSQSRDILPELQNMIRQYEALSRRSILFVSNMVSCELSPVDGETVLRVAGEAIGNAVRHSQANQIDVVLHDEDRVIHLQVRDDGVGLPTALPECSHFGIVGMRERAEIAGGTLVVTSSPNAGTVVNLQLPINERRRR